MNTNTNKDNMDKRLEAEWLDKLERAKEPGVDVRSFFTDEEIRFLLSDRPFTGRVMNFPAAQRHKKIGEHATWLKEKSLDVIDCQINKPNSGQPNAMVFMDVEKLTGFYGKEHEAFVKMCVLSDDIHFCATSDKHIRFSFGVLDIFKRN